MPNVGGRSLNRVIRGTIVPSTPEALYLQFDLAEGQRILIHRLTGGVYPGALVKYQDFDFGSIVVIRDAVFQPGTVYENAEVLGYTVLYRWLFEPTQLYTSIDFSNPLILEGGYKYLITMQISTGFSGAQSSWTGFLCANGDILARDGSGHFSDPLQIAYR